MKTDDVMTRFGEILKNNSFSLNETENFFVAMSEILDFIADELEKNEPYAITTIARYRAVASDISDVETAADIIAT